MTGTFSAKSMLAKVCLSPWMVTFFTSAFFMAGHKSIRVLVERVERPAVVPEKFLSGVSHCAMEHTQQ